MADTDLVARADISPNDLARLAREISMDICELPVILKKFNLTVEQFTVIEQIPFFKNVLEAAIKDWSSSLNTHERMKIEAAAILEEGLPILGARMKNKDETFAAATEAGKLFAKIAGLGEVSRDAPAPGERFTISINLGGDVKLKYEREAAPAEPAEPITIEGTKNE